MVDSNVPAAVLPILEDAKSSNDIAMKSSNFTIWQVRIIFLLTGVSHLWFWNTILNLTTTVNDVFFVDRSNLSTLLTTIFEICCSCAVVYGAWQGGLSSGLNLVSGGICVTASLLVPIVLYIDTDARYWLWLILGGILGGVVGLQQSSHYAIANCLPEGIFGAWVSVGEGIGGMISYALCLIMVNAIGLSAHTCVWIQLTLGVIFGVVATAGPYYIVNQAHVQDHIKKNSNDEPKPDEQLNYIDLFKTAWFPLTTVWLAYFSTYSVFPNIGPFQWFSQRGYDASTQGNVVMGFSQLGVMLGRGAPNIRALIIPKVLCFSLASVKFAITVMFVLAAKYDTSVFSSYAFQIIALFIMSLSEGWLGTSSLINSASMGERASDRSKLSTMAVCSLCFGISIGMLVCPGIQKAAGL